MAEVLKIDPESDTWRAISNFVDGKIRAERSALEIQGTAHEASEAHRAVIAAFRELKRLAKPPTIQSSETLEGTSDAVDG